jgi:ABC-2 type transport system ATP-binding protein
LYGVEDPPVRPVRLEVRGLSRHFGARAAVRNLSLILLAGECVALAGPNGAGKSTALRLLAGLLPPHAGEGHVVGCDLRAIDSATRNAIGFLPQRSALYGRLSALENLRFRAAVAGLHDPMRHAHAAADTLQLGQRAAERLGRMSGGWVRRIELAATLIHQPQLILLDEPTTGLDDAARDAIWTTLAAHRAAGAAVVFTSHDAAEIGRAGHIVRLDPGAERAA